MNLPFDNKGEKGKIYLKGTIISSIQCISEVMEFVGQLVVNYVLFSYIFIVNHAEFIIPKKY